MLQSDSISLMVDELTDISVLKQLVIYCRCVVDGELRSHFLRMRDRFNGTAETFKSLLLQFLQDVGLNLSNVSSFGQPWGKCDDSETEWCSHSTSEVVSIHCVAYRLALAVSQALPSIKYMACFKEILSSVFYFYHNSPVRQSGLTLFQIIPEDPVLRLK